MKEKKQGQKSRHNEKYSQEMTASERIEEP